MGWLLTPLEETDVTDDEVILGQLDDLRRPESGKRLIVSDRLLETSKLFLLRPVVNGRHEDDDDHSGQDGGSLDPLNTLRRIIDRLTRE